jgi:cytochrome c peroxidase
MFAVAAVLIAAVLFAGYAAAQGDGLTPKEQLGEFLYFDTNLSEPDGQSCASCHTPEFGFDDPDVGIPVSEGVILGRFGDRNSPMSAYAMYAPVFHFDGELWVGGQFWDGRATGHDLGDPLADQAIGPPLNPVEMANPDKATYVTDVAASEYADLFEQVWGAGSLEDIEAAYDQAGLSVAAFERTALFGQFNSKYDYYLATCLAGGGTQADCAVGFGPVAEAVGTSIFSKKEWDGFQLFMNETNDNDGILEQGEGAMCVLCHVANWTAAADYTLPVVVPDWAPAGMVPPVFTDFTFDNLGVPKNWDSPFLYQDPQFNPAGEDFIDLGLYRFLTEAEADGQPWYLATELPADYVLADEMGKFKVMTLRNIHLTRPYAHNGYFKGLEDITHFYNTRDALPDCAMVDKPKEGDNCWYVPEVPATVNDAELGNLGLSDKDEDDLVKFMKTLSDGWWTP